MKIKYKAMLIFILACFEFLMKLCILYLTGERGYAYFTAIIFVPIYLLVLLKEAR